MGKTELVGETCSSLSVESVVIEDKLARKLSSRQVSMIAIAGVIGTGLFLGTGKSLVNAGPASLLIGYLIIGVVVYETMLCLGEMATFMPVAGSFCTYASRFIDPAVGFAMYWNYWFGAGVSVGSDLTALELVLKYWNIKAPGWSIALIFWVFLLFTNIFTVRAYGEVEYWLSLLKIVAVVIFLILGIVVNAGANTDHEYLGFKYWHLEGAPFVHGFKGFATVFVTASFAYASTESLAISAGEAKNPRVTIPRVIRTVFWRILFFYVFSVFFIGINVPYTWPKLSTGKTAVSPFTIVFQRAGSVAGGSFINAVIVTSVISAGNHGVYAGTRLLYSLGAHGMAPKLFSKTTKRGVPWAALLATWLLSGLFFGSSFIATGTLWSWLQALSGISKEISWLCIGVSSLRFRAGIKAQGKEHELVFKNWTYPWGPRIQVVVLVFILLVQGWSSFAPWDVASFFQNYIELIIFPIMWVAWKYFKKTNFVRADTMDLVSDVYVDTEEDIEDTRVQQSLPLWRKAVGYFA